MVIREKTKKVANRFYKELTRKTLPNPSLYRLMMFRMTRESLNSIDIKLRDYYYFKEQGWFDSDYYHETKLGFFKKIAGRFFDFLGRQLAKSMQ